MFDEKKYKQDYDKLNYKKISCKLKKDYYNLFKSKLDSDGLGVSEFIKNCIEKYMNN